MSGVPPMAGSAFALDLLPLSIFVKFHFCVVFDLNMIQSMFGSRMNCLMNSLRASMTVDDELVVSAPMAADDELDFCAPMPAADEFGKPTAADDELDFSAPMAADALQKSMRGDLTTRHAFAEYVMTIAAVMGECHIML